ncbi:hypothetical protein [Streptomyces sp. bgisy027]|uniref:hypothetical protein n=1 Tax=Streptomyces sp. bgisy027 TaxID=3413770 RepID=UPI003D750FF9
MSPTEQPPDGIEEGSCSACGRPAERGPSGAWWHVRREDSCGRTPARFSARQQQTAPRDRQIRHPGRDR